VTTGLLEVLSRAELQSNHHHQQNNIQFFTGRMSFLSPNQQCLSTEGTEQQPPENYVLKIQEQDANC